MATLDFAEHPHRRLNLLTGEWVLVSPHRTRRPWQGQIERLPPERLNPYEPDCYLCPGNARAGGRRNPHYTDTFVFDNDFAALLPETPPVAWNDSSLLMATGEPGVCRVICFSPRHDLTLARMDLQAIRKVVDTWIEQFVELASRPYINYVQIFENRGEMMGCSNPHPHCQVWANYSLPNEIQKESRCQLDYRDRMRSCLLCDYWQLEAARGERLVVENEHFLAVVPFWAIWPFETLLISRRHLGSIEQFSEAERDAFAEILKRLVTRYDNLFEVSFPYSMGFHQRPCDGGPYPEWHFHVHFYPPLLRSATIRKFMVGYEMLAMPQRDLTPEAAAARLREMSEQHYTERGG